MSSSINHKNKTKHFPNSQSSINKNNDVNNHTNIHANSHIIQSSYSTMKYPIFPEALLPRLKDRPVKNSFTVKDTCPSCHADLFVVIYYRSDSLCEVRIRRLDNINWDFNIHLQLFSINDGNYSAGYGLLVEEHVIGKISTSLLFYIDYFDYIVYYSSSYYN